MKKYFTNTILNAGVLFSVVMFLFFVYANCDFQLSLFDCDLVKSKELQIIQNKIKNKKKLKYQKNNNNSNYVVKANVDSSSKRFLLIGDSQVGGLMYPFYNYCKFNGHDLAFAQVWYSARDVTYANNDTLKMLIEQYKPDHIVMVIGLNQVYQDRFTKSEEAIEKILATFGSTPYTWIGPASWIPDNGITNCYRDNLDEGCFYPSDELTLDRGSDGRHPSSSAYYVWMDSIASWMQNESAHHILMKKPNEFNTRYKFAHKSYNAGRKKNDTLVKDEDVVKDTGIVNVNIDSLNN